MNRVRKPALTWYAWLPGSSAAAMPIFTPRLSCPQPPERVRIPRGDTSLRRPSQRDGHVVNTSSDATGGLRRGLGLLPRSDSTSTTPPQPRLRLVGAGEAVRPQVARPPQTPLAGTMDPRWVLAVRVAERLQGSILAPASRESLVRLGTRLGLTPFDANLIIAIVQDQARRGYAPSYCPTASEPQLRMVPPPRPARWLTTRGTVLAAGILVGLITLELILLSRVF